MQYILVNNENVMMNRIRVCFVFIFVIVVKKVSMSGVFDILGYLQILILYYIMLYHKFNK